MEHSVYSTSNSQN